MQILNKGTSVVMGHFAYAPGLYTPDDAARQWIRGIRPHFNLPLWRKSPFLYLNLVILCVCYVQMFAVFVIIYSYTIELDVAITVVL